MHNLKSDNSTSFLSSLVLDASDELPHQKSHKENRFIYRFVYRDLTSFNMKASDGDSSTVDTSPTSDMDCTLKSGDYVVHFFSCIRFVHDVILAKFTSNRSELFAQL